jgi:hypothetical protein
MCSWGINSFDAKSLKAEDRKQYCVVCTTAACGKGVGKGARLFTILLACWHVLFFFL